MPEEGDPRKILPALGTLKNLKKIWDFQEKYEEFQKLFEENLGEKPTGFQRTWMKRIILGKSFTAVAPTGVGKTTFGILSATWFEKNGKRSAIILPTLLLVDQVYEKLSLFGSKGAIKYHSKMKSKEKKEALERISLGEFSTLVISTQFLSRSFDKISNQKFDFVFVDDVDSVLKSSKNIEKLLIMVGFSESEIENAYKELNRYENDEIESDHGILVVSSATAKPRGKKPLLFKKLLGFEIGRLVTGSRNLINVRCNKMSLDKLRDIVDILKDGILIFTRNSDELKTVTKFLKDSGIRVEIADEKSIESFEKGEINALAGISSYYGKLVRGIDLPFRVKYAIFYGVPVFEFALSKEKAPMFVVKRVLRELIKTKKAYQRILKVVEKAKKAEDVREMLKNISDEDWNKALEKAFEGYSIEKNIVRIPDVMTYIQASGRTSRYTKCGMTKGISFTFEKDDLVFEKLRERIEWLLEEEWYDFDNIDLEKEMQEVEESRKERSCKATNSRSILFIVESPTKALMISSFFGRSSSRTASGIRVHETVYGNNLILFTASRGHVYDLVTDDGIHGVKEVKSKFIPVYGPLKRCRSCGYQFTEDLDVCPVCGSKDIDDKSKVMEGIRELSLEVDEVYVATDPDTEGEKISYDIEQYVKPVNAHTKRIEIHEITRREVKEKIESPREFDEQLVKAQVIRRIQDRWIGFELSKKVQTKFRSSSLSAGRVQSTVLGWIVSREIEYQSSEKVFSRVIFDGRKLEIEGRISSDKVEVKNISEKVEALSPLPPHTTDSLLSEASKTLKLKVPEIMNILQNLFESGLITYHRTDSIRISQTGQTIARRIFEKENILEVFQARSWGSGGAHEAIRPTKPFSPRDIEEMLEEGLGQKLDKKHLLIYSLIYKRFLTSQAKDVKVKKQKVILKIGDIEIEDETTSEILEHGWDLITPLKIYKYDKSSYKIEKVLTFKKHTIPLFTQATLIEEMKKREIGRPSTYARTVDVLFKRGYVREDRYGRLWPTKLGKMVYQYLKEFFEEFVTDETTRNLERIMDMVEKGEEDYQSVLKILKKDLEKLRGEAT